MYISKALRQDLDNKGVPAWFVREIFSRDYHTDGMMLAWMFLPEVARLPVTTTYQEKYGHRAARQADCFTKAAMRISLRCFLATPGFYRLGNQLEKEVIDSDSTYGLRRFFKDNRLKHDRNKRMSGLIEASFWSSHDYDRKFGDWGFNPMNQTAHAAHVFTEATSILGEETIWQEAVETLQEAVKLE